jgi:succinate-semialdehyde dehydrogenase/glutarate-semialdehyde dehydrogenase
VSGKPCSLRVRDPRTGEIDFELAVTTAADIEPMARAMRAAQQKWKRLSIESRIEVLQAFKTALAVWRADIVSALEADTGRRRIASIEVQTVIDSIDNWCRLAPALVQAHSERPAGNLPLVGVQQRLEPYALLGAITPWNFPMILSFIDVVPALLAGCAALIKPSEVTPRFFSAGRGVYCHRA